MGRGRLSPPAPLAAEHDLSAFDCGVPVLNDWLKQPALKNEGRFARTYVVCEGARVAAYYCISAGTVERTAVPGRLRRNAPDMIPVAIIGRLAVCRRFAGHGLGADVLADALRRIAAASHSLGIAAVLIHAKDEQARRFYQACAEFIAYPADGLTLFLPIETVIASITAPATAPPN